MSLSCILKNPTKIFSFLPQNPAFCYSGIFCEMLVLLLLVYLDIAILKNDVHIVNMSNGNSIYHVLGYHIM